MEYKDFLTNLGKTALRYAELPMDSEDLAEEVSEVNDLGKTIDQAVRFDDNGIGRFLRPFTAPLILMRPLSSAKHPAVPSLISH